MLAEQSERWQLFYEKTWAERAEYMRSLLNTGKYNTMQIISMLEKKQRFFQLAIIRSKNNDENNADNQNADVRWLPIRFDAKKEHRMFNGVPMIKHVGLLGNLVSVPFYTQCRIDQLLIDLIDTTGPYDAVIELGCGYGRNLFNIFYGGGPTDICYFGGEYTKSGEEICRDLATATPSMKTQFFHFNHLEPDLSIIREKFERVFIFTVHTIEQVTRIPDNWFSAVSKVAPFVRCVHIEPFGFQATQLGPLSKIHKESFVKNQWNMNFYENFLNAKDRNEIEIEDCLIENLYSTDICNMSSFAVWKHGEDRFPPHIIE
ncbi:MAG: hypothetical protein SPK83_06420 [Succinivibrio dextrinosolvens]|uniref:hypothetical protein n=1 Tax=Succinivibrio sp. TaxID=2053619 RepID=UPI0025D54C77|nr:hypothetical protein [Succinivibrio sp.]MBQ9221583.1 hypothetical protein [Succinivibrio sp.]MDY6416468.1 hypothetical protein [Succinivibrio dextrinosolvens]MDY6420688.1 hypothetical protein [Succinivibrio dextrinosolvens]